MKVVFDLLFDASGNPIGMMWLDTATLSAQETLAAIQADKSKMTAAGYDVPTQLPALADGTRRWDVIVASANKATAPATVKALNLTA